jgi:hypothetical protein
MTQWRITAISLGNTLLLNISGWRFPASVICLTKAYKTQHLRHFQA